MALAENYAAQREANPDGSGFYGERIAHIRNSREPLFHKKALAQTQAQP